MREGYLEIKGGQPIDSFQGTFTSATDPKPPLTAASFPPLSSELTCGIFNLLRTRDWEQPLPNQIRDAHLACLDNHSRGVPCSHCQPSCPEVPYITINPPASSSTNELLQPTASASPPKLHHRSSSYPPPGHIPDVTNPFGVAVLARKPQGNTLTLLTYDKGDTDACYAFGVDGKWSLWTGPSGGPDLPPNVVVLKREIYPRAIKIKWDMNKRQVADHSIVTLADDPKDFIKTLAFFMGNCHHGCTQRFEAYEEEFVFKLQALPTNVRVDKCPMKKPCEIASHAVYCAQMEAFPEFKTICQQKWEKSAPTQRAGQLLQRSASAPDARRSTPIPPPFQNCNTATPTPATTSSLLHPTPSGMEFDWIGGESETVTLADHNADFLMHDGDLHSADKIGLLHILKDFTAFAKVEVAQDVYQQFVDMQFPA
ncbi:hypothetical protein BT69DRAFT_1353940 [Atractiella rhizophila]|nr:hypothetical protein BT69DRAFT_1353940 [Atractiella rhizophila]